MTKTEQAKKIGRDKLLGIGAMQLLAAQKREAKPKTDRRSAKRECLQVILDEFWTSMGADCNDKEYKLARRRAWRAIDKLNLFPMRAKHGQKALPKRSP